MNINPIDKSLIQGFEGFTSPIEKNEIGSKNFSDYLKQSVDQVSDLLKTSDEKSTEMVTGKTQNIHEAMLAFEKAETAMKFLVQVRNKVIEAYNEILRMQV